ncbi:MraY family glycosyltransferase [Propionivibrio dicarboxylicus]|uniref:UDP-N-acetylmuramyl pentapeptide phosphotransferase/UDP-N-acetylglucosamine-1-phosphate transferase n=1 Tax=Propionivibrio dicarboxylicus TaxID=83767 RepID=A0A1G8ECF7_9RHOO|nr:glycosyltransferase [Propionivibrio dicarboxylicus]SDH67420.1 UDP-N-acetylmuramyl pentapeptide phosphotransferase/UDP-N-acetylglucosamine-1-phosphate transferase [Propionivibrio dicarboxylicus]
MTEVAPIAGFFVTLAICVLIVLTQRWHGRMTLDCNHGVQKFHVGATPRVGGVGILAGLVAVWVFASSVFAETFGFMLLAGMPAFLFGLAEDLTKSVSVRARLLATMASGFFAWSLTGISLTEVDVWGIDALLKFVPISVLVTMVAVAGVANSVNIIDGFNGLAAGSVIICLSALGIIAADVGDSVIALICLSLIAVLSGFLLVNFPLGKLFLGDGGAYLLGFLLAWLAVMLPMRNPSVSEWAPLLACGYPVLEVLFSMMRRYKRSLNPGHPDRLHLHSLVKTRIIRKHFKTWPAYLKNAAVSPICWVYAALPASLAVLFNERTPCLMASFAFCALVYWLCYRRLVCFHWGIGDRTVSPENSDAGRR